MRHLVKGKKLNRNSGSRRALKKVMVKNFFRDEEMETTLVKAKYIKPDIEKIITKAKKNDLATRRLLISLLDDKELVEKLLTDIGPRFKDRNGGYTRIVKTRARKGDMTELARISMVELSQKKSIKPEEKKETKSSKKITNVLSKSKSSKKKEDSKKEVESKNAKNDKVVVKEETNNE